MHSDLQNSAFHRLESNSAWNILLKISKDETRELQAWEEELNEREEMLNDRETIAVSHDDLVSATLEDEVQRRCSIIDEVLNCGRYLNFTCMANQILTIRFSSLS